MKNRNAVSTILALASMFGVAMPRADKRPSAPRRIHEMKIDAAQAKRDRKNAKRARSSHAN